MSEEIISAGLIQCRLNTRQIGRCIIYKPKVSSTMDLAIEAVQSGATHGTVVVAETQEQGKGRLARTWVSPPGGVYLSVILYPPPAWIPALTMVASLAVRDGILSASDVKTRIKWPNDIIINGKKVAGILATSGSTGGNEPYAIVGIGINVDIDLASYPEIEGIAISLSSETGKSVPRIDVICGVIEAFEKRYDELARRTELWREWKDNLETLGKHVKVTVGGSVYEGIAETVNNAGSLLLRLSDGMLKEIPAGDVTLRA